MGEARGKQYFDGFRGLMADFANMERELMEKRQAENVATVSNTIRLIVGCIIVATLIGLLVAYFVTRSIMNQVGGEPADNSSGTTATEIRIDTRMNSWNSSGSARFSSSWPAPTPT